jgi:hypothetical protein
MRLQNQTLKPQVNFLLLASAAFCLALINAGSFVQADYLQVYGGPTYTPGAGGYLYQNIYYATTVNDSGTAAGYAEKFDASDNDLGSYAVRWNDSEVTELGNLGTYNNTTYCYSSAINAGGTTVGYAEKYDASGNDLGSYAVRWDAAGTAATELGNLGLDIHGQSYSYASGINSSGTVVGKSHKYEGSYDMGFRAVRWDAGGTAATELGYLGTRNGVTYCAALAINDSGTIAGYSDKYDELGTEQGSRAVRWDAGETAATELGHLGLDINESTSCCALAINSAGTAAGYAQKYDSSFYDLGKRAVRWDAAGTTATELGNLGTDNDEITNTSAYAINDLGTTVGYAEKYDAANHDFLGTRAVLWDAGDTTATELGNLGTNVNGVTTSYAYAINAADTVVGYAYKFDESGDYLGQCAVYWGTDGVAVDLNTLIDPDSGWTLISANAISDTSWIAGIGLFDPDGLGGQEAYDRLFLLQVPEPSLCLLLLSTLFSGWFILRRRRR